MAKKDWTSPRCKGKSLLLSHFWQPATYFTRMLLPRAGIFCKLFFLRRVYIYLLLIGPRSDHCLALSLSLSLTALCQIGQTRTSLITFANDLSKFLHDFLEFIHLFHFIIQKLVNNNVFAFTQTWNCHKSHGPCSCKIILGSCEILKIWREKLLLLCNLRNSD